MATTRSVRGQPTHCTKPTNQRLPNTAPLEIIADGNDRHVKFEYKYSFKGPHLVNKDGSVPFWKHDGSAIASDEQVRITPSLKDKKGFMWTKNKFNNEWWEVESAFRVTGRGRIGADGLAFWYRDSCGDEGPVFGTTDKWNGLGIIFDSFDNDGQQNNPYVSVVVNDGTKSYDHFSDGRGQDIGGCLRDFRNRPHPVRVRVRYYQNVLTLWLHMGMSPKIEDFELCTRVENVMLPKDGHFGISAATGGLADDHDVLSFITHSITPPKDDSKATGGMTEDEQRKLAEQYEEYQKKLEKQKEDYAKEHPDKKRQPDAQYETSYERDIRLVYEGQNAIHHMINQLHTKAGELTVQVNSLQTLVMSDHNKLSNVVTMDTTINRQEVNTLINLQQQLSEKLRDVGNVLDRVADGGGLERRDVGFQDYGGKLNDVQSAVETLTHSVNHLSSKQQFAGQADRKDCPPPPPMPQCIGPGYFVILVVIQIIMLVGYVAYQHQKEAAAKKFY